METTFDWRFLHGKPGNMHGNFGKDELSPILFKLEEILSKKKSLHISKETFKEI